MEKVLLMEFLSKIDKYFTPNLSQKTELSDYCDKLLSKAQLFVSYSNGGAINGLVALYANDFENHYAYVSLVAVDSDYRNQGIARNLLVQAINHVRGLGVDKIQKIGIYTNNHIALHLYETLNFCRISVSQNRYYLELSL